METRKEIVWRQQAKTTSDGSARHVVDALVWGAVLIAYAALSVWRPLRIGVLVCRNSGRFLSSTEFFLRRQALEGTAGATCRVFVSTIPVNRQILRMLARRERVIEVPWLWRALGRLQTRHRTHPVWIDLTLTGWMQGDIWQNAGPQLSFSDAETAKGKALLKTLGIPDGAPYVCFAARDPDYRESPDQVLAKDDYWATSDYRNCDVDTYMPALEYLASQGIWTIRMGFHGPANPLPADRNPMILDYAHAIRPTLDDPEFADVYLPATTKFFLGCTSGIYLYASMFAVPIAYTNMVPFLECGRTDRDLFLWKKCRDRNTGTPITYADAIAHGLDSDYLSLDDIKRFEAMGLEIAGNSEDEIVDLVTEMCARVDGTWREASGHAALVEKFDRIFPRHKDGKADYKGDMCAAFLKNNEILFDAGADADRNARTA